MPKPRWNRKSVRSGLEERVRKDLDRRGIEYGYESIRLRYTKKQCPKCGEVIATGTYTPDFIFQRTSGIRLVLECKGYFDSAGRTKMGLVKRDNPTEDIRFLFQRDQPIRKGSRTKYSDWCVKNGFPYEIGESVPERWLK